MYHSTSLRLTVKKEIIVISSTCHAYVTLCYSPVIAVDQLPVLPHSCSPLDGRHAEVRPVVYTSLHNLVQMRKKSKYISVYVDQVVLLWTNT